MNLLDQFSKPKSLLQAQDVRFLVRQNTVWLERARPQTLERNRNYYESWRSVWRACDNPDIMSFILFHPKGYVDGLGTITLRQTVHHPEVGSIEGNQIDMWFKAGILVSAQSVAIKALYNIARGDDATPVFGALTIAEQERAAGLSKVLTPVGGPGELIAPHGDPFGILAGDPVQLYAEI